MLNYQSTSYHDAALVRDVLHLKPAPQFLAWLEDRRHLPARATSPESCSLPSTSCSPTFSNFLHFDWILHGNVAATQPER